MTDPSTFDSAEFRAVAGQVIAELPPVITDYLAPEFEKTSGLVEAMAERGEQVWARLARRGRDLPAGTYPVLAIAILAVRTKPYGVQKSAGHIVTQYDRLTGLGDVPLDVALQSRLIRDDLAGRLVEASRVAKLVRAEKPATPGFHIGMVTCAVLCLPRAPQDPVRAVLDVFQRADLLAARHRSRISVPEGPDPAFRVVGNVDIVGQVAAYRVAVMELAGHAVRDADTAVHEQAVEVMRRLRRAMDKPFRYSDEPDAVLGIRDFARQIGGPDAMELFKELQRDLFDLSYDRKRPPLATYEESLLPDGAGSAGDSPADLAEDIERKAGWIEFELYANTTAGQRAAIDAWLAGRRAPDLQDDLALLLVQVRRVDRRVRRMPRRYPQSLAGTVAPEIRDRIQRAVRTSPGGWQTATAILPPLWSNRAGAIHYLESKLRLLIEAPRNRSVKAALVANVVVRGPAHRIRGPRSPGQGTLCTCADGVGHTLRTPHDVCPHRQWTEPGWVENYRTLMAAARLDTEAAVARQLDAYDDYWKEWVHEAFDREV